MANVLHGGENEATDLYNVKTCHLVMSVSYIVLSSSKNDIYHSIELYYHKNRLPSNHMHNFRVSVKWPSSSYTIFTNFKLDITTVYTMVGNMTGIN